MTASDVAALIFVVVFVYGLWWSVKPNPRECPICGREFDSELEMHAHFERRHQ